MDKEFESDIAGTPRVSEDCRPWCWCCRCGGRGRRGARPPPAAAKASADPEGYRETAHVKRFYELARKF